MYRLTLALLLMSVMASATYYDSSRHAASRLHFDKKPDYPVQDEAVYEMPKKTYVKPQDPGQYLPVTYRTTTSRYVLNEKAARAYWRTHAYRRTTTPYPVKDVANVRPYEAAEEPTVTVSYATPAEAPVEYPTTSAYVPPTPAQDPTTPSYNPTTPSYEPTEPLYFATTPAQDPTTQPYVPNMAPQYPTTPSYVPPARDPTTPSYVPPTPAQDPKRPYVPPEPAQDPTTPYVPTKTPYVPPEPAQDPATPYVPTKAPYVPPAPAQDPATPYVPAEPKYVPTTPAQDPTTPLYVDTTQTYVAPVEDVPLYVAPSEYPKDPAYVETTTAYVPPAREEPVASYASPVEDTPLTSKYEAPAKHVQTYDQPAKDRVRSHPRYKSTYTTAKYVLNEAAARKYWATATYPTTTKAVKYAPPSYVAPLAPKKAPVRDEPVKPSYGY